MLAVLPLMARDLRTPRLLDRVRKLLGPLDRLLAALDAFFRKRFRADSLATWFLRALRIQHRLSLGGWGAPNGNYYEFGVGRGRTMLRFLKALKLYCKLAGLDPYSYHIFGFDSFQGLPFEQSPKDDHACWRPGLLNYSLEQVSATIGRHIDLQRGNVRLIKGLFEDSLTPELALELAAHPPSIVTIDVDYYSSTKTVLDWLAPNLPSGCLFYFDDLWIFFGHPKMGELAAINEFNQGETGCLVPYSELNTTVGGRTYIFVRKKFEYTKS